MEQEDSVGFQKMYDKAEGIVVHSMIGPKGMIYTERWHPDSRWINTHLSNYWSKWSPRTRSWQWLATAKQELTRKQSKIMPSTSE